MAGRAPLSYSAQPQQRTDSLGVKKIQIKMGDCKAQGAGERTGVGI